jgi:hypothetical protein
MPMSLLTWSVLHNSMLKSDGRPSLACHRRYTEPNAGVILSTHLGKMERLESRYSERLFWHDSSCSPRPCSKVSRPSMLQASKTLGNAAVSTISFPQARSTVSKRFASCVPTIIARPHSTSAVELRAKLLDFLGISEGNALTSDSAALFTKQGQWCWYWALEGVAA